jgi:purine-binding chemotaxis protein CheW
VTKQKTPNGDIESPDVSLSHYFDDLLGIGDVLDEAFAAVESRTMPVAANSGLARVVNLPTKKNTPETPKKTPARIHAKPLPVNKSDNKVTELVEPELVQTPEQKRQLEKLLQSASAQLLVKAPVADVAKVDVVAEQVTESKTHFVIDTEEIQEWDITTPAEMVIEPVVVSEPEFVAAEIETHASQFKMEGLEWMENGRPQWAQSRFDVLLFKVAGLTLAVPLVSLGQIQPLTDELTPLFGQADWFMGLQPTPAGKIRTVNTAKFVMPERYDDSFLQTAKYVMSINGVPWGLAVDSVNQPITLQPDDVKWRGDRGKRPWLAGTVKDHMCALLDIPRIGQMLIEADKNFISA